MSGSVVVAQTFVPSLTGALTQVDLQVTTVAPVDDVIVQIQTLNALGNPSGDILASVTIAAANVPIGTSEPLSVQFGAAAPNLVAGFSYAIVVTSPSTVGPGNVGVDSSNSNPYVPGVALSSVDSGMNWVKTVSDIVFTTTMQPPIDPRVEVFNDPDQSGFDEGLMWGNFRPGQIHGYKFDDVDGDGIVDPGEPRLANWEIQLLNEAGEVVRTEFTNDNGEYWFLDLTPGTYFVREVQQLGWLQTTHDPQPYTITRGEVYVAYAGLGMLDPFDQREEIIDKCLIFGNTVTSSIHGYKFHDLDGNGLDDNDPRVAGVTITLTGDVNGDGLVDQVSTLTDVNGDYWFEDIYPGTYTVTETVPDGWVPSKATSTVVVLARGEEAVARLGQSTAMGPLGQTQFESNPNANLAFGNTILGSIHGYKFKDKNFNGLDDNEPRVAGVQITLEGDVNGDGDQDQVVTYTDVDGEYWFEDLYPGTYTVTETPPIGTIPIGGVSAGVTIISGEEAVALQGQSTRMGPLGPGQFESAPNPNLAFSNFFPGSIHGHKFEDIDGDGVEDANEPRLDGWTIVLTDSDGNPVTDFFGNQVNPVVTQTVDLNGDGNITANEQGLYWFSNLLPGSYLVREVDQDLCGANVARPAADHDHWRSSLRCPVGPKPVCPRRFANGDRQQVPKLR